MSDTQHAVPFRAPDLEEVAALFPAYDIHALIACGGMGAVYQATQRSLERVTAIKILPREFSTDDEFRKGFEQEAKAMAKLNHPNLIGVYDFGEVDGMLYLVMEYVDGKSLFHSAKGHAVDQADALRIVTQVCAGLENAHSHGILHRDIKPANILLDANVNPKVGDFGLARALESQIEEGEQIFGTPGYTAPEVLEPPFTFDQRADVFSVGVMLYELLTGKLPGDERIPVSQLCTCNPRLDAIVTKATNPYPSMRYSTAAELGAELDKIASSPSGSLVTTGSTRSGKNIYSPPTYQKKSSSAGIVVLLLFLAVAAAAAYVVMNKDSLFPEKQETTQEEASPKVVHIDPNAKADVDAAAEDTETPKKLDVTAFLREARGSIAGRVRPFIEKSRSEVRTNTGAFERSMEDLIGDFQGAAKRAFREAKKEWDGNGHRIPESLPETVSELEGASELLATHLDKQTEILTTAAEGIKAQESIYIIGLENQVEQSRKVGDNEAISQIELEIEKVKTEDGYFRSLFGK